MLRGFVVSGRLLQMCLLRRVLRVFLCELGEASRVCGCSPNREGTRTTAWGLSLKSEASEVDAVLSQGITAVFSCSFSTLRTLRTANETEMIRNHVARSPGLPTC